MKIVHVSLLREKVNDIGDLEQFHLALLQLLVIVTGLQTSDDAAVLQLRGFIGQIADDIVRLIGLQSNQFRNKIGELRDLRRQRFDLGTRRLGSLRLC